MTAKQFTKKCRDCGYAYSAQVKKYIKTHEKEDYTEDDIESIFREYQPRYNADEKYTNISGGATRTTKHYYNYD